ncbi:MAG: type IV pilus twitching motility protein PilT [Lactobacillales bacterium]|jgi:twitching motility protein PilT|nr:type IV pilus twitching motility protein PilT [Lactobacillales bacterium]
MTESYESSSNQTSVKSCDTNEGVSIEKKQNELRRANGILDGILNTAVEVNASDVHIISGLEPIFRLNGRLTGEVIRKGILENRLIRLFAEGICTKKQWEQFLELGEVDLAYDLHGKARFRVNIFKEISGVSIAFRKIPAKIPTLEELAMPSILREMVYRSQGLFLVTGPTGSGKSTTLAAMIDYLNETKKTHILTLEDPIEYVHHHKNSIIAQREIGRDTESFGNGLRAALRQDPDVILVGELRDLDTISIALTAAETGHLVLGTLHTSSAASTIERIVDVFPPEQQSQIQTQLAGAITGILSQRLLPNYESSGRVAMTEMLVNTKAVANLIRSGKTHMIANVLQMGKADGMYTMEDSIRHAIQRGMVDVDSAENLLESGD